ncbi:MAG: glutamate--tRNA ligase family protein [Lentisphaeria bacterium]|jgi:glutamyl-tRNA synthetase
MSAIRLRFAPSPTGHVHIGNIRAAIFNWLYARHCGGTFLLRIEDTDLERSTPAAIHTLLDVMEWLGLGFDEPPLHQTSQRERHLAAAAELVAKGHAYRHAKGGDVPGAAPAGEAVLFRIPWAAEEVPGVAVAGPAELEVDPGSEVVIDQAGIRFAQLSNRGTPMPVQKCLAGFQDLEVIDAAGSVLLRLNEIVADVLAGRRRETLRGAAKFRFTRRSVSFRDLVKGELSKPLDSLSDFVIVRSDGSPVFHLGNVVDDITQKISHIVRGDDHVENTYRHIFLFHCLGAAVPAYAHLPMIVNAQGKPYSKRDGDAYVGDFRTKGFLPQALFNYLALLGWSPGDDREKMSRDELVAAFTLDRVRAAASQMDLRKLTDLNGQYIAELPAAEFRAAARDWAGRQEWWRAGIDEETFAKVCALMQIRTKTFADIAGWGFWFKETPDYDEKGCAKQFKEPAVRQALEMLAGELAALPPPEFTAANVEATVHGVTAACGILQGKLNQPLRLAVTGTTIGAGIYETLELLGRERTLRRLEAARRFFA